MTTWHTCEAGKTYANREFILYVQEYAAPLPSEWKMGLVGRSNTPIADPSFCPFCGVKLPDLRDATMAVAEYAQDKPDGG